MAIIASKTMRSTPESGSRAGYYDANRKRRSKFYFAFVGLGQLSARHVTPASERDCAALARLAETAQVSTDDSVTLVYAEQVYAVEIVPRSASVRDVQLQVIRLLMAKRGFALLSKRWAVE